MKRVISAIAIAAVLGSSQAAFAAPPVSGGNQYNQLIQQSFTIKKGKKLPQTIKRERVPDRDFKRLGLKQPPRGQQWVKVGSSYVLIAATTGLIMSILGAATN